MDERDQYLLKTLRAVAIVAGFAAVTLAAYQQFWAIAPLLAGTALAVVLLLGWDRFIQAVFTPEKARMTQRARRAFLLFALVKYPLVAALIWWLSRNWDSARLMVFTGGFLILQAVMVLRGIGRMLTENRKV